MYIDFEDLIIQLCSEILIDGNTVYFIALKIATGWFTCCLLRGVCLLHVANTKYY